MASSKLLKEAIADAKAVRETAIANAKIALEEAFTPRLQSILSKKLTAEMEGEEEEVEVNEDNDISTGIGTGDNKQPTDKANSAQTDLSGISKQSGEAGSEVEDYDKVKDLTESEDEFGAEEEIPAEEPVAAEGEDMAPEMDMEDEDELDLESIIRELEAQIAGEEGEEEVPAEAPAMEGEEAPVEEPVAAEPTEEPAMEADDAEMADDEIDLDEILREMGYGDDEAEEEKADDATEMKAEVSKLQSELEEDPFADIPGIDAEAFQSALMDMNEPALFIELQTFDFEMLVTKVSEGETAYAAYVATFFVDTNILALILSFSPGGIYEVAVIAIAFDLDPDFVAFHHIIRLLFILFTVPIFLRILEKLKR